MNLFCGYTNCINNFWQIADKFKVTLGKYPLSKYYLASVGRITMCKYISKLQSLILSIDILSSTYAKLPF